VIFIFHFFWIFHFFQILCEFFFFFRFYLNFSFFPILSEFFIFFEFWIVLFFLIFSSFSDFRIFIIFIHLFKQKNENDFVKMMNVHFFNFHLFEKNVKFREKLAFWRTTVTNYIIIFVTFFVALISFCQKRFFFQKWILLVFPKGVPQKATQKPLLKVTDL